MQPSPAKCMPLRLFFTLKSVASAGLPLARGIRCPNCCVSGNSSGRGLCTFKESNANSPGAKPEQQQAEKVASIAYELHTEFVYRGPDGVDPSQTSYVLFPGQGSQFVGMGAKLLETSPKAKQVYEQASAILKYDLLKLCLRGPQRQLSLTQFCQPAVYVTSIAALTALEVASPEALPRCVGAAGYSVGELAALTFAGALNFEEGVKLVQIRAQAMQTASDQTSGGMATCLLGPDSNIGHAMGAAIQHCKAQHSIERPVCSVASHLYAKCVVVAGHKEAMQHLLENHTKFGVLSCKPLPVTGAFHTDLMRPAARILERAVSRCSLRVPRIPVYSNVSVKPPKTAAVWAKLLVKQLHKPVQWNQILSSLTRRPPDTPHPSIYEVGPGQQLGFTLQKINNKAFAKYSSVPV